MSAAIFEKQGDVLTVMPEGRLDTVTSPLFENELIKHLDGIHEIILDFVNVEYISSGGLRMLLATEQLMGDRGGSMKLIHVNEYIIEVFNLVGLMDLVTVVRD